jgi:hypothetical protein
MRAPSPSASLCPQAVTFRREQYSRRQINDTLFDNKVPPEDHEKVIADLRAGYYEAEQLSVNNECANQSGQQGASAELGPYAFDPAGELFMTW